VLLEGDAIGLSQFCPNKASASVNSNDVQERRFPRSIETCEALRVRALVQRVREAHVDVIDGASRERVGEVGQGICVLVGVTHEDTEAEAARLAEKVADLRIFPDADGAMNLSLVEVGGAALVVSQFTLYGDTTRGRRPGWSAAARPEHAEPLVEAVVAGLRARGVDVATGRFRTDMEVGIVNDGPCTLMIEI
jgi:D-tyrosyl-tRNA(Tyr) deacylase